MRDLRRFSLDRRLASRLPAPKGAPQLLGFLLALGFIVVAILLLSGCAEPAEAPSPVPQGSREAPGPEADSAVRTYDVRGMITQLPDGGPGRPTVHIRHEAIPDFVNSEGYETGMQGMTMPFPLADGVDVDGYEVGDAVRFTFVVDWEGRHPMLLTAIEPLAPASP